MAKQLLKYLMASLIMAAATSIAKAQEISLGHTTPAASNAQVGGLSYTYSIGQIGRIITTTRPTDASAKETKPSQQAPAAAKALAALAYPNPCTDYLRIKADAPIAAANAKIQIIDSKGGIAATIDNPASDGGEITIDLAHFAQGKYVIRIITDNLIYTATAIKI